MPNPYLGHSLIKLGRACMRRAGDLEPGARRTPKQRADLAEDTRFLLLEVASALNAPSPRARVPGSPEMEATRVDYETAFWAWYQREVAALRVLTAERALHMAFDGRANDDQAKQARVAVVAGDDDLRAFLQDMQRTHGQFAPRVAKRG